MRAFALTVLGSLVWVGLRGRIDLPTLIIGLVLSAAVAHAAGLRWRAPSGARQVFAALRVVSRLTAYFIAAVFISNVKQLRIVLDPRVRVEPRWVHVTSRLERPSSRAALGVLVSMTPGTVTADLDGNRLSVHVLSAESDEAVIEGSLARFEDLLYELEAK
jgi:multisubunit Na+/H+ antiporter MnhE subunit